MDEGLPRLMAREWMRADLNSEDAAMTPHEQDTRCVRQLLRAVAMLNVPRGTQRKGSDPRRRKEIGTRP